jgi:hypothetical protein
MNVIFHKNVVIKSASATHANEAIILSHGGYTPSKIFGLGGSGTTTTPAGTTVKFNASHDNYGVYTHGLHLLGGAPATFNETVPANSRITNYSLENHDKCDFVNPNTNYDVITISPLGKAHLSDVFEALKQNGIQYTAINSFHCRVNKTA